MRGHELGLHPLLQFHDLGLDLAFDLSDLAALPDARSAAEMACGRPQA